MKKSYKGNQTIIPPQDGWQERTLYLVDVSYNEGNPIHRALFYSGFLDRGWPNGYNGVSQVLPNTSDADFDYDIHEVYYLKVVSVLAGPKELHASGWLPPEPE